MIEIHPITKEIREWIKSEVSLGTYVHVSLVMQVLESQLAEKDKQIEELREGLKESFKHLEEITWWETCPDDMKEEISKLINDSDLLSKESDV